MTLKNRKLIVTGGARGIGRAVVEACLREGAKVAVFDIDVEGMRDLGKPQQCWTMDCDVRDEQQVLLRMRESAEAMGGVDGVVNSAGVANGLPFEDTDYASWKAQIETNLNGTFLVCKAATPWMRQAGGGSIVNIASAQALLPTGSSCSYTPHPRAAWSPSPKRSPSSLQPAAYAPTWSVRARPTRRWCVPFWKRARTQ